ncbi:hypothetical protein GEMRC1_010863 [Eukaryota sp. GEM-RC1]
MCAAPGSKSAQIIDFIAQNSTSSNDLGLLLSNDASQPRAYMMQHNLCKLAHGAPASLISNNDGREFPFPIFDADTSSSQSNRFDSVLSDVPCSGIGTLRKNPMIWSKYAPKDEFSLHPLQLAIALRSAMLVKIGGRLVYSTCSFSPVENEAVVAALLNQSEGALRLLDVSSEVTGLVTSPGLNSWELFDGEKWYGKFEDVSEDQTYLKSTMFPPQNVNELNLNYCMRINPQDQDTGGFFICVFEKVKEMPGESNVYENQLANVREKKVNKMYQKGQFSSLDFEPVDPADLGSSIVDFGIVDSPRPFGLFRSDCLVKYKLQNCPVGDGPRKVFLLSPSARQIAIDNFTSLRLVGGGLQIFEKFRMGRRAAGPPYRLPSFESASDSCVCWKAEG